MSRKNVEHEIFIVMKSLESQIISEDERIARVLLFSFLLVLVSTVVISLV